MPLPSERADEELMLDVQRGDLAALDILFARHHRRLFSFLARLTGDRDAADDLVQEVFLRLIRFRASYGSGRALLPWLFRIARNLAADRWAERRATVDTSTTDLPHDVESSLDDLIVSEQTQQLERAVASLPAQHREVLLLRGVEQLSHRDLATALHCTEGAARTRLHRALQALRTAWHATIPEVT